MSFGREIDDVPRRKLSRLVHEHFSRLDFLPLAGRGVGLEVIGECILELQRDPASHDPDAVHRIDDCVNVGLEDVANPELNHSGLLSSTKPA